MKLTALKTLYHLIWLLNGHLLSRFSRDIARNLRLNKWRPGILLLVSRNVRKITYNLRLSFIYFYTCVIYFLIFKSRDNKIQISLECVLLVLFESSSPPVLQNFHVAHIASETRKWHDAKRERAYYYSPSLFPSLSLAHPMRKAEKRERNIFQFSLAYTSWCRERMRILYRRSSRAGGVYERINFIPLFPWGCMRKCQLYIATASPDIICDIGAFPRRDRIRVDRERGRSGRQIRAYARDIEGAFTRVVWHDSHGNLHKSTMHSKFAS